MDKFIERFVRNAKDRKYLDMARELDLMASKPPSKHPNLKWISKLLKSVPRKSREDLLYRFSYNCYKIRDSAPNRLMNLYNFARWLIPDEAAKISNSYMSQKLNEYYRICWPTFDPYPKKGVYAREEVITKLKANLQ